MNALETAYEIRQRVPAPKIIFISSDYTPDGGALMARLYGDGHFVPKAEIGKELVPIVNRLLGTKGRETRAAGSA